MARTRASFLEGFYSVHVRIRYVHDKTYEKVGWYKRWNDKGYSATVHRTVLISFVISFVIFQGIQMLFPYLNLYKPREVRAGSNSKTWTTRSDFMGGNPNANVIIGGQDSDPSQDVSVNLKNDLNVSIRTITASQNNAYLLKIDGTVVGVGTDANGQVTGANGWTNIKSIAAGENSHVIGLKNDGKVVGAGYNSQGQINVNTWTDIKAVFTAYTMSFGIKNDGSVVSTGYGMPDTTNWRNIKQITGYSSSAGVMALKEDGTVICTGNNCTGTDSWTNIKQIATFGNGWLGLKYDGTVVNNRTIDLSSWQSITQISGAPGSAYAHIVGLKSDGKVVAYGSNNYGALNVGTWENVTEVASGYYGPVALKADGTMYATGRYVTQGTVDPLNGGRQPTYSYYNPGTITGLVADAGEGNKAKWTSIGFNHTVFTGEQAVKFRIRVADDLTALSTANWYGPSGQADPVNWSSNYFGRSNITGDLAQPSTVIHSTTPTGRYAEVYVYLQTAGDLDVVFNDVTIGYDSLEAPENNRIVLTKTNNDNLLGSTGGVVTGGAVGGFTSQDTVRVNASGLTCGLNTQQNPNCAISSTNLRPEAEVKPVGTPFANAGAVAIQGNSYVDVPDLIPGQYHMQVRAIDDEGRASAWTPYGGNTEAEVDFTVDQTVPNLSINVSGPNVTGNYVRNNQIDIDLAASGVGPANLYANVSISNNGLAWSDYTFPANWNGSTGKVTSFDVTSGFGGNTNQGTHTLYVKIKDNAGNISGVITKDFTFDTQAPAIFALSTPGDYQWQSSATPTLTWSQSSDTGSGLLKYQLFVDVADPNNPGVPNRDNIAITDSSATPSAPLSRGYHTWFVRAVDKAGNITNSTQVFNVGFDNTAPARVSNFSATTTENTRIIVSWSAYNEPGNRIAKDGGAPAVSYKLERIKYLAYTDNEFNLNSDWSLAGEDYAVFSGCSFLTGDKINFIEIVGQPHSCNDQQPPLVQGVKYVYRIAAKKDNAVNINYGAFNSSEVYGMTRDSDPPSSPTNVSGNADNGFQITVTWSKATDAGSGISRYLIWRSQDGVVNATHWRVVGVKEVPNPPPTGYLFNWIDNDINNATTDATYKPAVSEPLNDDTDYFYRVTAVDAATPPNPQDPTLTLFPSDPTLNVTQSAITTPDNTPPAPPAGISGSSTIDNGHTDKQKITLTWPQGQDWKKYGDHNIDCTVSNASGTLQSTRDANCGRLVRGYKLWYAPDSGGVPGAWTAANGGAEINATTFTIDNLEETSYYWFRLKSVDNSGNESDFSSNYRKITSSSQVPQPPTNVRVTAQNDPAKPNFGRELKIEFNDGFIKGKLNGNSITGYRLYRWQLSPSYNPGTNTPAWDSQDVADLTSIHDWTTSLEGDTYGTGTYEYTDVIPETDDNKADAKLYVYRVVSVGINPSIEPDPQKRINGQLSSVDFPSKPTFGWDILADNEAPKITQEPIEVKNTKQSETEYRNIITWPLYTSSLRNGVNDFASYAIYRYENDGADLLLTPPVKTITDAQENFWVDRITMADAGTKKFYYAVVASDNAGTVFRYPNNGPIVSTHSNVVRYPGVPNITPHDAYPTVSAVTNDAPGVASVTIHWNTNQPTDSVVEYQKTGGEIQGVIMDRSAMKSSGHAVTVSGLEKNTSYQYRIISRNNLGNIDPAEDGKWNHSFKTEDFSIQNIRVPKEEITTTNANIYWETPINADSDVEYKPEGSSEASEGKSDKQMLKTHKLNLENLKSATTYTYKVRSITGDKFVAETGFMTFTTPAFDTSQFVIQPNASNVAEQNITATSAKIVWNTAVATSTWVDYSDVPGDGKNYKNSSGDEKLNTVHVVELLNLTPGKTYYYRVRGTDSGSNEYKSPEYQFTAVLKPEIQNLKVDVVDGYNAKVTFNTNVDTESSVSFGEKGQLDQKAGTATVGKGHSIDLKNLTDGSSYSLIVEVKDKLGNSVKSNPVSFSTPIDKNGAKVNGIKIDLLPMGESDETAQAIISWTTDKPTTTKIEYDEGVLGGKYSKSSIEDNSLNTSHTVIVKELNPSATYHFKIAGKDKRGNATTSTDYTFVTPNKEKSVLQLILKSLEETFSWVKNVGSFFSGIGKKTK